MSRYSFLVTVCLVGLATTAASTVGNDAAMSDPVLVGPNPTNYRQSSSYTGLGAYRYDFCFQQNIVGYIVLPREGIERLQKSYPFRETCSNQVNSEVLESNPDALSQNTGVSRNSVRFRPNSKVTVTRKSEDGSAKVMGGTVQVSSKTVVVNYSYKYKCGVRYFPNTLHQEEWQATFNLTSGKWSNRVKNLTNCLGNATKMWQDWSQGQFRIDSSGRVISAEALDVDGSVLDKNALVVKQ
jgi:hypothetical protein